MIHQALFALAVVWLAVLLAICIVMVIRAESSLTRVLIFDLVTIVTVALLVLFGIERGSPHYLDVALVLALVSFVATVAAARFESEDEVFS